ncbi:MAG: tRNA dihydrouridine synthase DusB [Clostridia bacterium]|nr:tRNA dihydrouridine synthase DusB [Clostridia bacterium]
MVKIKNIELKSNLILAPMAGFSDVAFRNLCLKNGAGLVTTEMVSSKALSYGNKKTEELLVTLDDEVPKAVQIFGHDPEAMADAVKNPLLQKFDIIDINMGCPAPKIVRNGDGSALLKNFELAEKIIRACTKNTDKPVTVKFRIGYGASSNVATEFAQLCERAGAAAITIHGRTTAQGYAGNVNYDAIAQAKKAVKIPVFANGNCLNREDYLKILNETGADGIMIGRGALGRPEIFNEILTGKETKINKLDQIKFHYETLLKFFHERQVVLMMRGHISSYMKGKYKNVEVLKSILKMETYDEILQTLTKNMA